MQSCRPAGTVLTAMFSSQCLVPADYLQVDGVSKTTMGVAVDICTWFLSHSVPYAVLKRKQTDTYGKTIALSLPGKTRWGSHHKTVQQLLATERALKSLVLDQYQMLLSCAGPKADSKRKAERVLAAVQDSNFWKALLAVKRHLGPVLVSALICKDCAAFRT